MKQIVKHIPNTLTLCNLLCGCGAVVMALYGAPYAAFWLVVAGALFDFSDGMAARLLKAYSPLGVQLDSLADMVTFGVAPSVVLFAAMGGGDPIESWAAFALAAGSALRLAKFNIDTEQTTEFRGLPTPAMALWVVSFQFFMEGLPWWIGVLAVVVFVALMTCRVPMFSLKFKSWGVRDNVVRYLFLALAVLAGVLWGIYLLPMVMISTYILYSLAVALWKR